MIFFIINVLISISLVFFSMYVDMNGKDEKSRSFVNLILAAGLVEVALLIVFISYYCGNSQLVNLAGRISMFGIAFTMSVFFVFCIQFPNIKKSAFYSALRILLFLFSILFVANVEQYKFSIEEGIKVISGTTIFSEFSWYDLFIEIYVKILPGIGALHLLLRMIKKQSRLLKQQTVVMIIAILASLAVYSLLGVAKTYVPAYSSLYPIAFMVVISIVYCATCMTSAFDFSSIVKAFTNHIMTHLAAAIIAGIAFAVILPIKAKNTFLFWICFVLITVLVIFLEKKIGFAIKKTSLSKDSDYEKALENSFVAFDYNESSDSLLEKLVALLKEHMEVSHVEILLDNDEGIIKSVFSSNDRPSKDIATNQKVIDFLAGTHKSVVMRSQIETKHEFNPVKDALLQMFDNLEADGVILLRESHHLFGLISLGPRLHGNDYTEYDYKVLTDLYSYFFLFGFYMKNIANQSVVGTVDREIQYSSQIIRSIQENVDAINNPSVDIGYLSKSARSLGGDFIDFIRLTDTRYIMIMGDVSGKGLNASMSMVILKSIIRTLLIETSDFKELIEKVNHFIKYNLPRGTFFAGVFALFDFADNTVYYFNCGLPVLFLYTESYNNVIEIQGDGKVLGFAKKISNILKVKKIKMNKGDILLACTDGLLDSESLRSERYGKDRVQKVILENKNFESRRLVQFLFDDMLQFTSKDLQDDVTAVAIRMIGE